MSAPGLQPIGGADCRCESCRMRRAAPTMLTALRVAEIDLQAAVDFAERMCGGAASSARQTLNQVQDAIAKGEGR